MLGNEKSFNKIKGYCVAFSWLGLRVHCGWLIKKFKNGKMLQNCNVKFISITQDNLCQIWQGWWHSGNMCIFVMTDFPFLRGKIWNKNVKKKKEGSIVNDLPCWLAAIHLVHSGCYWGMNLPGSCSPSWVYLAAPVWGAEGGSLTEPST